MKKKYFKKDISCIYYIKGIIYMHDGTIITKDNNKEEYFKLISYDD